MLEKERKEKSVREVINLSFDVNQRILSFCVFFISKSENEKSA